MRKQCNECGEFKHAKKDFYKRANRDTPRHICKACFKDKKAGRYKKPEKYKLHDKIFGY